MRHRRSCARAGSRLRLRKSSPGARYYLVKRRRPNHPAVLENRLQQIVWMWAFGRGVGIAAADQCQPSALRSLAGCRLVDVVFVPVDSHARTLESEFLGVAIDLLQEG